MPSRTRKIRVSRSTSKAASTKTLPVETNPPADPTTMLATPEQLAAITNSDIEANALAGLVRVGPNNTGPTLVNIDHETTVDLSERAVARAAAAAAVAAFYNGASLPFKAAVDLKLKSPINFNLGKNQSARSAALIAAIITYCDIQPDGTFVRGSGRVPGKLLGYTGKQATQTFAAGPESGGLSNLMPDRITYISGETSGRGCENAVFRLNFEQARVNMLAFNSTRDTGGKIFSAPLRLLRVLETKPTKLTPASVTDQPGDNVSDRPASDNHIYGDPLV